MAHDKSRTPERVGGLVPRSTDDPDANGEQQRQRRERLHRAYLADAVAAGVLRAYDETPPQGARDAYSLEGNACRGGAGSRGSGTAEHASSAAAALDASATSSRGPDYGALATRRQLHLVCDERR